MRGYLRYFVAAVLVGASSLASGVLLTGNVTLSGPSGNVYIPEDGIARTFNWILNNNTNQNISAGGASFSLSTSGDSSETAPNPQFNASCVSTILASGGNCIAWSLSIMPADGTGEIDADSQSLYVTGSQDWSVIGFDPTLSLQATFIIYDPGFPVPSVPEPATLALLGIALAGLAASRRWIAKLL